MITFLTTLLALAVVGLFALISKLDKERRQGRREIEMLMDRIQELKDRIARDGIV